MLLVDVDSKFVVSSSEVLDKGVSGTDHAAERSRFGIVNLVRRSAVGMIGELISVGRGLPAEIVAKVLNVDYRHVVGIRIGDVGVTAVRGHRHHPCTGFRNSRSDGVGGGVDH